MSAITPRRDPLVRSAFRRDALVASAALCSIIYPASLGTTSVPLQPSEGPACQVRRITFDNPFRFSGHDRHAPPTPVGPACQVRYSMFDYPSEFAGHDKRAPPAFGGTCLSGPPNTRELLQWYDRAASQNRKNRHKTYPRNAFQRRSFGQAILWDRVTPNLG